MPQPTLKPNWFHILVSLIDQDRHGYAIMQEVEDRTSGQVRLWPATLYGSIRSLKQAGFIAESEHTRPADDDPRRIYYRLTPYGRRALEAEIRRLQKLVNMALAKGIRNAESS